MLISCLGEENVNAEQFCRFVDSRIRLQLVYDIHTRAGDALVEETQLFPGYYNELCAMPAQLLVSTTFMYDTQTYRKIFKFSWISKHKLLQENKEVEIW